MKVPDAARPSPAPIMPAGVFFRPAGLGDAVPLYQACYAERPRHQFLNRFRYSLREQERGRRIHMLVEREQKIIGTGKLIRLTGKAEIADLMIAPAWRGRGIGSALIRNFLTIATQWGYTLVEIGAEASNPRALALYRRLGFSEEREFLRPEKGRVIMLTWRGGLDG